MIGDNNMMSFLLPLGMVIVGLALLSKGSDFFVDGASNIASKMGISEMIIGLTLVAFGTSLPEWIASIIATLRDPSELQCPPNLTCYITDLALGNVIGSNITNVGLGIGLVGLLLKDGIKVQASFLMKDVPLLIIISIFSWYFSMQGSQVSRIEGIILFVTFVAVLLHTVKDLFAEANPDESNENESNDGDRTTQEQENSSESMGKNIAITIGGLLALLIGSQLLVDGASDMALQIGISEQIVGITMVAFGTSVPELATSIAAGRKGKHDMLLGGIIGSNTANLAVILGSVAFLVPVNVNDSTIQMQFPVMMGMSILLWVFMLNHHIHRWQAGMLLLAYLGFTVSLFF